MTPQQLQAMKQALEALKWANKEINEWREDAYGYDAKDQPTIMSAVNAINEALEQPEQIQPSAYSNTHQPEQEPVRIMGFDCVCGRRMTVSAEQGVVPAPQRKPLTDEEIGRIAGKTLDPWSCARAIEAAHGIKE